MSSGAPDRVPADHRHAGAPHASRSTIPRPSPSSPDRRVAGHGEHVRRSVFSGSSAHGTGPVKRTTRRPLRGLLSPGPDPVAYWPDRHGPAAGPRPLTCSFTCGQSVNQGVLALDAGPSGHARPPPARPVRPKPLPTAAAPRRAGLSPFQRTRSPAGPSGSAPAGTRPFHPRPAVLAEVGDHVLKPRRRCAQQAGWRRSPRSQPARGVSSRDPRLTPLTFAAPGDMPSGRRRAETDGVAVVLPGMAAARRDTASTRAASAGRLP